MIKRIIFWQNIISPHYASMFKALADIPELEVILVAQAETLFGRAKMGWAIPDTGKTRVVVNPGDKEIENIFNTLKESSAHIFSGTRAYPMVWKAFQIGIKTSANVGFLGESLNWLGWKGKLRMFRSKYDALFLNPKIKYVLANGQRAVNWYKSSGYSQNKIFDWAYFVDRPAEIISHKKNLSNSVSSFQLLYVGRLSPEKGVDLLIKSLCNVKEDFFLTIIGEGPEKEKILKLISANNLNQKVEIRGFVPHSEIFSIIASSDLLILPSTGKDGWGAVINEALLMGTPVLASSYCGASDLLANKTRGIIFDPRNESSLSESLHLKINEGKPKEAVREQIRNWSWRIEGKTGAQYVLDVLNYALGFSTARPQAPWKEN